MSKEDTNRAQDKIRVYRNLKTVLTQGMFPGGFASAIIESQRYLDNWEEGLMESLPPAARKQMAERDALAMTPPPPTVPGGNGSGKIKTPIPKRRGRKPKAQTSMPSA